MKKTLEQEIKGFAEFLKSAMLDEFDISDRLARSADLASKRNHKERGQSLMRSACRARGRASAYRDISEQLEQMLRNAEMQKEIKTAGK